ncbi:Gfo/Idh/MocA family protein [Metallosphaera javensis (ex Sakai et al. 2022)]|uniref:Gfo/Idh/MocA family protein n=1 Tax=Metallosphaera javensis (ex Sakai et al. 2022) TaxID=2775498 RepID=UPI00258C3CFB|nr:MAG: putative oxidoreductase YrbE [Metallosphaera javensis (ex Sakai et al. 2022)]
MRKVQAIVVGAGRMGKVHSRNLKQIPNVELKAIVDIDQRRASELANEVGAAPFSSLSSAIASVKPDLVVITSSTQTHLPLIKEAAENGAYIFVEKPMGLNSKENEDIVRIVQSKKVKLQVGFQRLYDLSFIEVQKRLGSGEIGKPLIAELISRDPSPQPGIGTILYPGAVYDDMAIHDFATMVWLFGFKKMTLFATGMAAVFKEYKEAGDYDNTLVNVKYYDGPLVNIDTSRCSKYGYDIRLEVLGENGLLKVENVTDYQTFVYKGDSVTHPPYLWFEDRFRDAYRREIEAFVKAVMNDERTFPDEVFGMQVGRISDAAKKSALEGVPVTVE